MTPSLTQRLTQEPLLGVFVSIDSPAVVEVLAGTGYDFVCVDAEHSAVVMSEIQNLVRAADAHGITAVVRVAESGMEISRVLDAGAAGVLVPRVQSAAEARRAVRYAKFPPLGARGAGPGRASSWGSDLYGAVDGGDRCLLAVQVEDAAGFEDVDAIAAVPGVDMLFVGPFDLSVSLGVPLGSAEHTAAIRSIAASARRAGCALGMFAADAQAYAGLADLSPEFVIVGSDAILLSGAARSAAAAAGAVRESNPRLVSGSPVPSIHPHS